METTGALVLSVLAVLLVVAIAHLRKPSRRTRLLRSVGFWFMVAFVVLFGIFIVGETLSDPGGWRAVGLIAIWLIPLVALCLVSWFSPDRAVWFLAPLVTGVIGLSVWFAINQGTWRSFENRHGPIQVVMVFALSAPVALWGLHRTLWAGVMLVMVGAASILVAQAVGRGGSSSLAIASFAPLVTGLLYLAAVYQDRGRARPGEIPPPQYPKSP